MNYRSRSKIQSKRPRGRIKKSLYQAALGLSKQGFPIFSLSVNSKKPIKDSQGFKDATLDQIAINELWADNLEHNIGIATGTKFGLFVIDIDVKGGIDGSNGLRDLLNGLNLPITRKSTTPSGGYHLYFRIPDGMSVGSPIGIRPGVDIRGDGGYIVAPPSKTSVGRYEWEDESIGIATAPKELIQIINEASSKPSADHHKSIGTNAIVHEGERNSRVYKLACELRDQGTEKAEATEKVIQFSQHSCSPALSESESLRCLNSAYNSTPRFALTDLGNAYRLQYHCSNKLKYVQGKWYCFRNGFWSAEGDVFKAYTHEVIQRIGDEAKACKKSERKKLLTHKAHSQSDNRLTAMLNIAKGLPRFQMDKHQFDSNDHLLGLQNGIYDLNEDVIHQHRPDLLVSKQNRISYDAKASCPKFEKFLEETFKDPELIEYVCKATGYALSGSTNEQCLFILHGGGANGKSVFVSILTALLGDYAIAGPPEMLVRRQRGSTNDIARLEGARLLTVSEESSNNTLDEALVKQLTGGDRIAARKLYQEHSEFESKVKIWITANNLPKIGDKDHGIWRRIRVIPFNNRVAPNQMNPNLTQELLEELPGILNWAVRGYQIWRREGLKNCKAVESQTNMYRSNQDSFQGWYSTNVDVAPEYQSPAAELYQSYERYIDENDLPRISNRCFSHRLVAEGASKGRTKNGNIYSGLKVKSVRRRRKRIN